MRRSMIILLVSALVIGGFLAYFASPHPDGLERVAEDSGFHDIAEESAFAVMPDYAVPGLSGVLSTSLAGVLGVLATFALAYYGSRLIVRKRRG